jgi:hypothetical protein
VSHLPFCEYSVKGKAVSCRTVTLTVSPSSPVERGVGNFGGADTSHQECFAWTNRNPIV